MFSKFKDLNPIEKLHIVVKRKMDPRANNADWLKPLLKHVTANKGVYMLINYKK